MKYLIVATAVVLLAACSTDPGSEAWCKAKKEQPKGEWTTDDAMVFAKHCLLDSQTIGSKDWCANLDEKDKSDWTAGEAADYAKHCVM